MVFCTLSTINPVSLQPNSTQFSLNSDPRNHLIDSLKFFPSPRQLNSLPPSLAPSFPIRTQPISTDKTTLSPLPALAAATTATATTATMSDSKIALLLNTNSLVGVQLIRKVAQLDYDIISVEIADSDTNDSKSYNYLAELPFTNPELKGRFQNISVKPNSDNSFDYFAILENIEQILNNKKSLDLIIDINSTDPKTLQLWDLKLILALFQKKLIGGHDSTIIIGNSNYNSNSDSTALNALHNSVTKISRDLSNSNIRCIDFTQINSLPGDESYIVETYTAEILRNAFKVQKLHSLIDFVKFIIYAYFPNFLISPIFFILTLLNLDKFYKQKTD